MRLSAIGISLACFACTFALILAAGCGGDGGGGPGTGDHGAKDSGSAGASGNPGRDAGGGAGGMDGGLDGGLDAGPSADAGDAASLPAAPTAFTVSSGGGRGSSARFNLQVGIGTPIAVSRGAGQSHTLSLGSPVLVQGSTRR